MSLFGNGAFMILQLKLDEINQATENANTATQNATEKLEELENFNFSNVDIGNYRFDHNQLDDTLELEYIGIG